MLRERLDVSTHAKRREKRRKILSGFPVDRPFETKEEVESYLSGEKVVCLLCGKKYRKLGHHLTKIHGMEPDEYRELYRIPWTYGLCSSDTSERYSKQMKKRMDEGWKPPSKIGDDQLKMISAPKRKRPFESPENYGTRKHPLEIGPDGKHETYTARRKRLASKIGSNEFKAKMQARPQTKKAKTILATYWIGRKQSLDHIIKRMKAIHGEEWEPK